MNVGFPFIVHAFCLVHVHSLDKCHSDYRSPSTTVYRFHIPKSSPYTGGLRLTGRSLDETIRLTARSYHGTAQFIIWCTRVIEQHGVVHEKLFGMRCIIFVSESKFSFYELIRMRCEPVCNVFTVCCVWFVALRTTLM